MTSIATAARNSFNPTVTPPEEEGFLSLAAGQELFRRVDQEELTRALKGLLSLDPGRTKTLLPLMKKPDFSDFFFKESRWIEHVLHAAVLSQLTPDETAKLFLYRAAQEYLVDNHPPVMQIVDEAGQIDEKAWNLLKEGLAPHYTQVELAALQVALKTLPTEETQFFCVRRPISFFMAALSVRLNHRLFQAGCEDDDALMQLVIPPALIEHIYQAKWIEQTMRPRPVFGLSVSTDFENPNQRDILIPSSLWTQPRAADGFELDPLEFYHHDTSYHLWLESTNPHRELWVKIAKKLAKIGAEEKADTVRDREFNYDSGNQTSELCFAAYFEEQDFSAAQLEVIVPVIRAYDASLAKQF